MGHDPFASMANVYDLMVDWPSRLGRERPFFIRLADEAPPYRVLDVGCGTGHHSRMFAAMGARVVGLDASAAMLARARALTDGDNPRFVEGDFGHISSLGGGFDLITVLGNTLPFVRDATELWRVLSDLHAALAPGGRLVIQVVNYAAIRAEGGRWLPIVHRQTDTGKYLFLREYRQIGQAVEFTLVAIAHHATWTQRVERSRHFPVTVTRLRRGVRRVGFDHLAVYSDFSGAPFAPKHSASLVLVAR